MQNTNTTNPQTFLWTGLEIDSSSIFTRTFNLLRTERCNSLINQGNGLQKTSTQLGCRNREAFRHFGWNVKNWGLPLSCPGVTSTAPQSAQGFSVLFAALLLVTHKLQAAVQKRWTFFPKPAILQNPAYIYRRSQKRSTAVAAPIPRRRAAPAAQRFRPEPLRSRTHSVSRLRLTAGKFSTSQRISRKVTRASGRARTAAPWGAPNNRPRCAEAIRPRGVVPGLVRALRAAPGAETLPEAAGAAPAEGGRPWGNGSAWVTRWTPPGGRPTAPGSGRNPRGPAAPQAVTPPPPTRCRSGLSKRPVRAAPTPRNASRPAPDESFPSSAPSAASRQDRGPPSLGHDREREAKRELLQKGHENLPAASRRRPATPGPPLTSPRSPGPAPARTPRGWTGAPPPSCALSLALGSLRGGASRWRPATRAGCGGKEMAEREAAGGGSGSGAGPLPGRCAFFVQRKRRFCKMVPAPGRRFCGEHGRQEVPRAGARGGAARAPGSRTDGPPARPCGGVAVSYGSGICWSVRFPPCFSRPPWIDGLRFSDVPQQLLYHRSTECTLTCCLKLS